MKIGKIQIDGIAALAPMAGVADKAVRTISKELGAAFSVGEMTSAKGIIMGGEKSRELLIPDKDGISAIQLFASNTEDMAKAVLVAKEYSPAFIDINMGCPAPKITLGGSGSALLKNIDLCGLITQAAVDASGEIPITVKIRKGYYKDDDVAVEVAKTVQAAGAGAVTIHARTRDQMYAPPIDINCITRVKNAVKIPVIGNGDIFKPSDAIKMMKITGCDMVMVGRGALGNPWIFRDINNLYFGRESCDRPNIKERMEMMLYEISLLVENKGEYTGFREARKHVSWYMTGLRGAANLRSLCGQISSMEDVINIKNKVIDTNF